MLKSKKKLLSLFAFVDVVLQREREDRDAEL